MVAKDWLSRAVAATALAAGLPASAAIYTVGNDAQCTHGTVQGAIDALPPGGAHEIRIKDGTYEQQAIRIASRVVTLRGGYADCAAATSTGTSILSGQGGGRDSVLTITGTGNDVKLEHLGLIRGDEVSGGYGGGLDVRGAGVVTTRKVVISQNYAGYGGGISFTATAASELHVGEDTQILSNTAQFSGGGVRVEGPVKLYMTAGRIWVGDNEALGIDPADGLPKYGYGGGVLVFDRATAYIGSPGVTGDVISGNSARYGGGLAVMAGESDDGDVRAYVFSTVADRPVGIAGNKASNAGGGIYLRSYRSTADISRATGCAFDFSIRNNVAQNGSAIYAEPGRAGAPFFATFPVFVQLNDAQPNDPRWCNRPAGAVNCTVGAACNTISGNRTETQGGTATDGAAILIQDEGRFYANRLRIAGNRGGQVVRSLGDSDMYNVLMAGNTVSESLVHQTRSGDFDGLRIENSTIADNAIGGSQVLRSEGVFTLRRSIVHQPGKPVLSQSGGTRNVSDVLANEVATLGGLTATVFVADPLFVDAASGDYRPHAASPAVDFSSTGGGLDLAGNPRGFDLLLVPDVHGSGDLGAYERVDVAPLVRNGDFAGDLRLWSTSAGAASWVNENFAGRDGALNVHKTGLSGGERLVGAWQCVPLPGPGIYRLRGAGRSPGGLSIAHPGDSVLLAWQLKPNSDASCSGTTSALGEVYITNRSAWRETAMPAEISIGTAQWTTYSRLLVQAVVVNDDPLDVGIARGLFDSIALDAIGDDTIFRNGFDG